MANKRHAKSVVSTAQDYKQPVDDEQLLELIESGIQNSVGDYLNSSDLSQEQQRATYEYAGLPIGDLYPNGASKIVDSSTTEVIDGYTAILSELLLANNKIAKFVPMSDNIKDIDAAKQASDVVNYCLFKNNRGWELLSGWIKASLLWKNSVIRWEYVEEYDYEFIEFEEIDQARLDQELNAADIEIVGELLTEDKEVVLEDGTTEVTLMYVDVRLRKKIDKSGVKLTHIPPENFRITRDATNIHDAAFVAVQVDMTRSEIRKNWPDVADTVEDWDELGDTQWNTDFTELAASRKQITGQEYWQGSNGEEILPLEANREVTVTEAFVRVDRDGDGIAELKRIITAGDVLLHEEDISRIPLASLNPIDIPHEFYGLSLADFTRSSTLANTAILRGFVENTYLTNYSPKLADPNVVDFEALQNMKPKQVIPTNGNPAAAVQPMAPETISTGTVPLLQHLQLHKEQATGMSKAAQGLQSELFVSGNSEVKLAQAMDAAQKRIQHIARRLTETGFKDLCEGVYEMMRKNMGKVKYRTSRGAYSQVDAKMLPSVYDVEIESDVGENSNANQRDKMLFLGEKIMPLLEAKGAMGMLKPEALGLMVTKVFDSLDLPASDYMKDIQSDEYKQSVMDMEKKAADDAEADRQAELEKKQRDNKLVDANIDFTAAQAKNTRDDNIRQTAVAMDKSEQEWAEILIKSAKEQTQPPAKPNFEALIARAMELIDGQAGTPAGPQEQQGPDIQEIISQLPPEMVEKFRENPEQFREIAAQNGIPSEMFDQVIAQL